MSAEARKAGIGFHLDHIESQALRTWIGASANKIVLPHPTHVLSMEGAAEVEMTETSGHFHFSLRFDPAANADGELTKLATSLLTAMIDDAKRLLLWVPDYANEHSNFSAFFVHDSKGRTRVSSSILYSDPDFIILASSAGHEICMWFQPDSEGKSGGRMSWDSRSIVSFKNSIDKDAGAQRYVRNGLAAREMPEGTTFSFDGMGGVPALIERRKEANKALLEGHTLAKHIDLEANIIYVDPDLVYLHAGFMRDYWIVYRREGLSEKRAFERAAGKRHAARAEKAMAEGAKPGNAFRKWVEKQDYEFDVAPHNPRN